MKTEPFDIFVRILIGLSVIASHVDVAAQQELAPETHQAQYFVRQLWSSDDTVRIAAKRKLIGLGHEAVQPLTSFLEDVIENPSGRYMTGKEQEGRDSKQRYDYLSDTNRRESEEANDQWLKLEITNRLKQDALDVLVAIRAEEAVPVMIKLTWYELEIVRLGYDLIRPPTRALIDMGPIAVPKLIETIETAEITAADLFHGGETVTKEERELRIRSIAYHIQRKAIIALREISDARALPALVKLADASNEEGIRLYAQEAIEKVFVKTN